MVGHHGGGAKLKISCGKKDGIVSSEYFQLVAKDSKNTLSKVICKSACNFLLDGLSFL